MKNLPERAILVNIRFGQWAARKYDKHVSAEIEKQNNAVNAGRFNKNLIGEEHLKQVQSIVSSARAFLKERTLPWGDNNDRLLPAVEYLNFLNEFRTYKDQFDVAVKQFISHYPALKQTARFQLNGLYRDEDYPTIPVLKKKFYIDVTCLPIADLEDFRVKVDPTDAERLKKTIEQEFSARIADATQNIWDRIAKTVGHMVERLSNPDHTFRDSLVSNVEELIQLLPRLNFADDRHITEVTDQMRDLLVDPQTLRENNQCRAQTARDAQSILDKISAYMPNPA